MLYEKLQKMWDNFNEEPYLTEEPEIAVNAFSPLLNIARSSQMIVAIYNFRKFKSDFISDNIDEILGLDKELHETKGGSLFVDNITEDHKNFSVILSKIMQECLPKIDIAQPKFTSVCCGLKYKHPKKGVIRLLNKQYVTEIDEEKRPIRAVFTTQDITHLMKDNFYWIYLSCAENNDLKMSYRSETGEKTHSSIISPREKDVLMLIAKGKDTDEIADELYISRNTVNNHRQNMLNRLGVKDTTALVHIARLCELL